MKLTDNTPKHDLDGKKWGHNELASDLAEHIRMNQDRIVWTDMQLGPSGSPRPDVYSMPKSYANFRPLVYEVKVSVADYRHDITSGKWQSYLKYASGVIFAVPAGLVKVSDLPPGCGLIQRHDNVWRNAKGPTLRPVENLPMDAWIKLMIDGINRQKRFEPRELNQWKVNGEIKDKYGEKIARALSDLDRAERHLEQARMNADKDADALLAEERESKKRARDRADEEVREIKRVQRELAAALGLPEDASSYSISRKAEELRDRLTRDGEIQHLRDSIQRAMSALNAGAKQVSLGIAA